MAHNLPMVGVATFAILCAGDRAVTGNSKSEAASAADTRRISSVTFIGADCIYGRREYCWEGHEVLPALLVMVIIYHGSVMFLALPSSLS